MPSAEVNTAPPSIITASKNAFRPSPLITPDPNESVTVSKHPDSTNAVANGHNSAQGDTQNHENELIGQAELEAASERAIATNAAVKELVDSMITDVSFAVDLVAERSRVQTLINNLVGSVSHDSSAENSETTSSVSKKGIFREVPHGDLRTWCLAEGSDRDGSGPNFPMNWMQTIDTVTVNFSFTDCPPNSARDVRVEFGNTSVDIFVRDQSVLREELTSGIDADTCIWSLDRANRECTVLTLELEKARNTWWPTLFVSHKSAAGYVLYHPRLIAARFAKSQEEASIFEDSHYADPEDMPTFEEPESEAGTDDDQKPSTSTSAAKDFIAPSKKPHDKDHTLLNKSSESSSSSDAQYRSDMDTVVERYRKAYESGGAGAGEAALQLAAFYHHGIGVKKDNTHAVRLYRYALEHGVLDSSAAFQLGLIYNQGCDGLQADPEEAVRWWTVSARLGNPVAYFNLGVMYMNGSGCVMDPRRAMSLFERAHSLNPQLRPPAFSSAQLTERVAHAAKMKKLKQKTGISEEDRRRRREEAKEMLRFTVLGTVAVVTIGVSAVLVRNWWRNHL